jgi:hypothetical protein
MTVSVKQLLAEERHKKQMWIGLGIAEHSAATFDAWTTRRALTTVGAQELNPLLKPFAGNASLYVAIQVGPAVMDYVGKKMMYSRHNWVRRMWWVPQSASFATSLFCGAHNLGVNQTRKKRTQKFLPSNKSVTEVLPVTLSSFRPRNIVCKNRSAVAAFSALL